MGRHLHTLRRRWAAIAVVAGLGACAGAGWAATRPVEHAATTQLYVVPAGSVSARVAAAERGHERVASYAAVASSPRLAEAVVRRLRLRESADELSRRVRAVSPEGTLLLEVTVTDAAPARAAALADAVAAELPGVVAGLEPPGRTAAARVTVLRPATAAAALPWLPLGAAGGLLAGIAAGALLALASGPSNTSIRRSADLERAAGGRPLALVPHDRATRRHPLATHDVSPSRAEAFRTLRTNLQFADVDSPPRVIVVTSALPGEGKTATACNLALTTALGGARVVLIEGDLRAPSVGSYLGIESSAGLTDVLAGRFGLDDVVIGHQRESLAVLPAGAAPPNPSELLGSRQMADLLRRLRDRYDVIVIDAPSLLPVTDAAVLASTADGAVLVVRHGRSRRQQTERAVASLAAAGARLLGTVLNDVPRRQGAREGYGYGYEPRHARPAAARNRAGEPAPNPLAAALAPPDLGPRPAPAPAPRTAPIPTPIPTPVPGPRLLDLATAEPFPVRAVVQPAAHAAAQTAAQTAGSAPVPDQRSRSGGGRHDRRGSGAPH